MQTQRKRHSEHLQEEGLTRTNDLVPPGLGAVSITVDGKATLAARGESLLSVLFALRQKAISKNDHGVVTGAYCGMGVCFSCLVSVDGMEKQRACQIEVKDGMVVKTQSNYSDHEGLKVE